MSGSVEQSEFEQFEFRRAVALAAVAGDLSPQGVARFARVEQSVATAALSAAVEAGLVTAEGTGTEALGPLVDALSDDDVAEAHAAAARHLMTKGPERLVEAVDHARAAGLPLDELVDMADHGGRMSLSLGDYASAAQLLRLAAELDTSDDLVRLGRRTCDLAEAVAGTGDDASAKRLLLQAAQLGRMAGDGSLVARAAVEYAMPTEWHDGDPQAAALLHEAEQMELSTDDRVAVQACRACVEMRIPLVDDQHVQVSWVTRPAVAQPLADAALDESAGCSSEVRLLALLAWRSTHRAPAFLARRREVSAEALDLAQRLRQPRRQVEAAEWLAVDALESADRPRFDECLAVSRWVAARDGNPCIEWRSLTLATGAAFLDGDLDEAAALTEQARQVGERYDVPGWFGFHMVMAGQAAASSGDPAVTRNFLVPDDYPTMTNPFGRALVAGFYAQHGQPEVAERLVRRSMRQLEDEAAHLMVGTQVAEVVVALGLVDLAQQLVGLLAKWSSHVAVDSHAWWCRGPVALSLAELHHLLGDDTVARSYLGRATPVATALNDERSLRRAADLEPRLAPRPVPSDDGVLTARELDVLRLVVRGETNPRIAELLAFSVSTVRMDTMSIYRKLGVKGRPEAVARALELRLLDDRPG